MKNTHIFKDYIKYTSLNVLGMIGLSCYILADTFFVSLGLGANGLAALNLAIPIYSFLHGTGLMIGMGGGIKFSILKSQHNEKEANKVFTNAVGLVAIFAILSLFIGIFASSQIVELMGAEGSVFAMCKTYLQVILLFSPMFLLNNVLLCFVRNDGAPQLAMAAMIGGSLSNIVLDYIFIFPCKMGIFGAVLATGLAPIISILILSPFFIKKKNTFHLDKLVSKMQYITTIFSGGFPSLITEVSSGIVIIVFNMIILKLQGTIGVAAYGVIANLSLVVMAIYTGIAQGIQPIISSNYGLGQKKNVRFILYCAFISMVVVSMIVYFVVVFYAEDIVQIFNSGQNTLLQDIAVVGLKYYFIAGLFAGFNIILCIYFTSIEYTLPAHILSLLRGFVIIIPMAFLLSSMYGIIGVWCTFPVTELLVSVLGAILYGFTMHKGNKKERILEDCLR